MANEMHGITGDILLDAGTNELEVLVFTLRGGSYGLNVAKVREVIKPLPMVAAPHQHQSVLGMFNIRGHVLPVVDLAKHLMLNVPAPEASTQRVIITEFNGLKTGFLVDGVEQIHRIGWSRVKPSPDVTIEKTGESMPSAITGLVELGERLVLMIDFESVADAILNDKRLQVGTVDNPLKIDRASKRVILAEDSPFMRNLISETFRRSGYTRAEVYSDGEQAWNAISAGGAPIDAIVSDIEMPRMDGLHLTRKIRETPALSKIPVILFSSLVSSDNMKKGLQVGATVQVPKPELQEMVRLVDRVISGEVFNAEQPNANSRRAAA